MQTIFELLAVLASGLFTGGALFLHFVEYPAKMELGPGLGVPAFAALVAFIIFLLLLRWA